MSIIKGGKNPRRRMWYDWALTPEAQAIGAESKAYQIPSNKAAPSVSPQAPRLDRDQGDRLRLRQVRLLGGAQAPAVEVGQGSQGAAEDAAGGKLRGIAGSPHRGRPAAAVVRDRGRAGARRRCGMASRAAGGCCAAVLPLLAALALRPWRMERERAGTLLILAAAPGRCSCFCRASSFRHPNITPAGWPAASPGMGYAALLAGHRLPDAVLPGARRARLLPRRRVRGRRDRAGGGVDRGCSCSSRSS